MFRSAVAAQFQRRHVAAAGLVAAGGVTCYSLANSDKTLGVRRQSRFWGRVFPVVAHYYWHFGSNSPYFKYQQWKNPKKNRDEKLLELHQRHAPEILQVMLDLKGLYVKLGQVLSVTALPIPESYRELFRTLQSDVPGYEEFEIVKKVLQQEVDKDVDSIFSSIDPIPCGAASIGQAHCAILKENNQKVIIKVQYPDASWQVPADIQCVGDFLKICVWAGVVEESAANISFGEFSRQFLSELDYTMEQENLQETYESSMFDPNAPYRKRGVLVPQVYPDLSTEKVVTMSYLPGPKLEEEARRQMELLGIDTKKGIGSILRQAARNVDKDEVDKDTITSEAMLAPKTSWKVRLGTRIGHAVGVDKALWVVRQVRRMMLWSIGATATMIGWVGPFLPPSLKEWSESHAQASQQAHRLALTQSWIDALFDVHGYQIFQAGLFNSDCHPGNILVIEEENGSPATRLGLIDYGQCKRLTPAEQLRVAELVLSVANQESDETVAAAFRNLGVQTKNDSTEFLAEMARFMFGAFRTEQLNHAYHKELHGMDRITYFPKELSMVYRTSLLLRGLAVSLQVNASVGEQWRSHAQVAVNRHSKKSHFELEQQKDVGARATNAVRQVATVVETPIATPL